MGKCNSENRSRSRPRPESVQRSAREREFGRTLQRPDREIVRSLGLKGEEQLPNETFVGATRLHLPIQNWLKTEARISSVPTAPITSPTASRAERKSTAKYSA